MLYLSIPFKKLVPNFFYIAYIPKFNIPYKFILIYYKSLIY